MIKHVAIATALVALAATAADAQGRGNKKGKVPPGHMPPAGLCRVWYDGVPPGRQPRPTSCAEAERTAARNGGARVIYGDGRDSRRQGAGGGGVLDRYPDDRRYPGDTRYPDDSRADRRRPTGDSRDTGGRAIPRTERTPTGDARRAPARRTDARLDSPAAQNGYRDGLEKGREDVEDRDSFDPNRHSWYRSADRGYQSRYGARESYRAEYRRAFLEGYESAYDGRPRTGGGPWWWPF
jgi:hypothetical protein